MTERERSPQLEERSGTAEASQREGTGGTGGNRDIGGDRGIGSIGSIEGTRVDEEKYNLDCMKRKNNRNTSAERDIGP